MIDVERLLDNASVITLRKRPDRGASFLSRWQTLTGASCRIVYGFDGSRFPIPEKWRTSSGAFGCCLAHVFAQARILSDAEYDDETPFFIMEDDAVFCDGFLEKLKALAPFVPDDYDVLYLGGEHLIGGRRAPKRVAEGVVRAYNVNRLHAYVATARALKKIFPRLLAYATNAPQFYGPSGDETCFDYEVGRMTEEGVLTVYAASPFLVGQGGFGSDTYPGKASDTHLTRFWN